VGSCGTSGVHFDAYDNPCTATYGTFATTPPAASFTQQIPTTPALGDAIAVLANTSTPIWTANTSTRSLAITFPIPPCTLAAADGSTQWYLTGPGWDFNQNSDWVPTKSLTISCATAQTVSVAEGH
jgi:hypothetical protein